MSNVKWQLCGIYSGLNYKVKRENCTETTKFQAVLGQIFDKNKYMVLVLESCYLLLIPSALTHKAISEKGIKFNLTNPKNLSQSIPSRPPHTINPENLWTSQPPMWERMKIIRGSIVERWERLAGKFGNWFIN